MKIEEFARRARAAWESEQMLRMRHRQRLRVLHNEHEIAIPAGMLTRAFPSYTHKAAEKLDLAKTRLVSARGVQVSVSKVGVGEVQERNREIVQDWLTSMLALTNRRYNGTFYDRNAEDCLLTSRWVTKVLPAIDAWGMVPCVEEGDILAVYEDSKAAKELADFVEQMHEIARRRNVPINVEHVPAMSVVFEEDPFERVVAAWEFREMSVREVLDAWRRSERLRSLTEFVERQMNDLSENDRVIVCMYGDSEWYRVALLSGSWLDDIEQNPEARIYRGVDEIIWESRHGMGICPYQRAFGRLRLSRNPAYRYHGFLDPIVCTSNNQGLSLVEQLDYLITQRNSTVRQIAWSTPVAEREPQPVALTQGADDQPPAIELFEGKVNALPAGWRLSSPALHNASDAHMLDRAIADLRAEIDLKTLPPALFGGASAASGYDRAQMIASAESVLEPFRIGLEVGYANVCALILAAARVVFARTGQPIPIRHVSDREGVQWITLTADMLDDDYEIQCNIHQPPIGGELAHVEVQEKKYQYGIISQEEKMLAAGNRNPAWTNQQRIIEELERSPVTKRVLEQYYAQQLAGSLLHPQGPALPNEPQIPSALADVIQSLDVRARFPRERSIRNAPNADMGLPDMAAWQSPRSPPSAPVHRSGAIPGTGYGQAETMPGGLARMADILGRAREQ